MDIPVRGLIIRGDLEAMVSISKGRDRFADVDAPPGSMQKRGEAIPVLRVSIIITVASLAGPGTGQRQMHVQVRDLNDGGVSWPRGSVKTLGEKDGVGVVPKEFP